MLGARLFVWIDPNWFGSAFSTVCELNRSGARTARPSFELRNLLSFVLARTRSNSPPAAWVLNLHIHILWQRVTPHGCQVAQIIDTTGARQPASKPQTARPCLHLFFGAAAAFPWPKTHIECLCGGLTGSAARPFGGQNERRLRDPPRPEAHTVAQPA